jgi:hypothetical protein
VELRIEWHLWYWWGLCVVCLALFLLLGLLRLLVLFFRLFFLLLLLGLGCRFLLFVVFSSFRAVWLELVDVHDLRPLAPRVQLSHPVRLVVYPLQHHCLLVPLLQLGHRPVRRVDLEVDLVPRLEGEGWACLLVVLVCVQLSCVLVVVVCCLPGRLPCILQALQMCLFHPLWV